MAETSRIGVAVNIFASPRDAFEVIRDRPRALLPWLLVIAGAATVNFMFVNLVDLAWYIEQQIRASAASGNLTEDQIRQAVERSSGMSPVVLGAIGAVSSAVIVTLIYFVYSLYLTGVSFATNDGIRLRQWFGLVCWCGLPALLGFLASIVNMLSNDATFMSQDRINPLSYASIFNLDTAGVGGFRRVLMMSDVTQIWTLVLTVLGYQAWTRRGLGSAAAIVLAPYILLIGLGLFLSGR